MKWKALLLALVMVSTTLPAQNAHAWGIVFDPTAYAQQLISYMNMIRQYMTQTQQYATQLRQLAAQTQNLQNLNYVIDLAGLQDMQRIIQASRGIASDYAQLQKQFDQVYPEFSKFSTMSGKDFAQKALEWNQETAKTNRDAMDLISKTRDWFNADSNDLRRLTVKANAVSGAKDGLQSIAQIAALQSKQLIQLQQTMSASAKVQGAYMAQKAEQEAAEMAKLQRWGKNFTAVKYMEDKGKPRKPYWEE